jgi:hypothetical protein
MKKDPPHGESFFMAQQPWMKWNQIRKELITMWQIAADFSFAQIV